MPRRSPHMGNEEIRGCSMAAIGVRVANIGCGDDGEKGGRELWIERLGMGLGMLIGMGV